MAAPFLLVIAAAMASAEQEGNAPQAGKTNEGVNNPADNGTLAAKEPCHKVKLENTDQPPVGTADDGKNQSKCIDHGFTSVYFLVEDRFPVV